MLRLPPRHTLSRRMPIQLSETNRTSATRTQLASHDTTRLQHMSGHWHTHRQVIASSHVQVGTIRSDRVVRKQIPAVGAGQAAHQRAGAGRALPGRALRIRAGQLLWLPGAGGRAAAAWHLYLPPGAPMPAAWCLHVRCFCPSRLPYVLSSSNLLLIAITPTHLVKALCACMSPSTRASTSLCCSTKPHIPEGALQPCLY